MTLAEEIKAIQDALSAEQDEIIEAEGGLSKIIRSENNAQWKALQLLAAKFDTLT